MVLANHLDLLEDKRFTSVDNDLLDYPSILKWFLKQEDYLSDELVGISAGEIYHMRELCEQAFALFEEATDHMIRHDKMSYLGIPTYFQELIRFSWHNREQHPLLVGRFDVSGGIDGIPSKIIEFNADTCTMLPETLYWQPIQLAASDKMGSYNILDDRLIQRMDHLRHEYYDKPVVLGTSLGHPEDRANIEAILTSSIDADKYFSYYLDLEEVVFNEDGCYIEEQDGYIKVDILIKLFPWDWAYNEEPELARLLSQLIMENKLKVLNPAYTTIWQNKVFLNYITENFPNEIIAKSYNTRPSGNFNSLVVKSSHGRLGGEVSIIKNGEYPRVKFDIRSYQEYLSLPKDDEGYSYQLGMYYVDMAAAVNIRCSESNVINDDCEFISHFTL